MIHGSSWPQKGMGKLYISQGLETGFGCVNSRHWLNLLVLKLRLFIQPQTCKL